LVLVVIAGLSTLLLSMATAGASERSLNAKVMALISEYPEKAFGGYRWPAAPGSHGTTRPLYHGGRRLARPASGTHCVGITFEVMWRALDVGARSALSTKEARRLRKLWFVPKDGGMGPAEALPRAGLGRRILDWNEARKGDFLQLWNKDRTLGHSAVFLGWRRSAQGEVTGVRYWSSQPWTDGIGVSEFGIGEEPGDMARDGVFIARLAPSP